MIDWGDVTMEGGNQNAILRFLWNMAGIDFLDIKIRSLQHYIVRAYATLVTNTIERSGDTKS